MCSCVAKIIDYLQTDWPSLACPSSNSTVLWAENWEKHGTCSQSVFDQYNYFNHAAGLKEILRDILKFLDVYGIKPDGNAYELNSLIKYLKSAFVGRNVGIECNEDASGKSQFYQVHICIEPNGNFVIDCPVLPDAKCADSIVFPSF
ncbi:ribonuclease 1-like [Argentina anserina]|uniref:ribonuclease 1-like n=1 Tax=Argentina anserina TaxID=57926 RepID=UPI002176356F|nr:ribonuclease 1-like [Potentilla anserina]